MPIKPQYNIKRRKNHRVPSEFASLLQLLDYGHTIVHEGEDGDCSDPSTILIGDDLWIHESEKMDILDSTTVISLHLTILKFVALLAIHVRELNHPGIETNSLHYLCCPQRDIIRVELIRNDPSFELTLLITLPKLIGFSQQPCIPVSEMIVGDVLGIN